MFEIIRFKIARMLADMANREIKKGTFKSIKKSCSYFRWSIMIVPKTKEVKEFLRKAKTEIESISFVKKSRA